MVFNERKIGGFVDSWPKTLVPSASNRSTPEWTLVDSVDSCQGRVGKSDAVLVGETDEGRGFGDGLSFGHDGIGRKAVVRPAERDALHDDLIVRYAGMLAQKEKLPRDQARRELFAAIVPGVYIVPNGVFGVCAAQEAGCGYITVR